MAIKVKAKKKAAPAKKVQAVKQQRRGRSSTSRISAKHQVTIPVEVLRSLNLEIGDEMKFDVKDGKLEIMKIDKAPQKQHRIMLLAGDMPGIYDDFDLEAERASWEREWQ